MYFLILDKFLIILINFLAIFMGFWVYKNNPKEKSNKIFALMIFLALLWINFAHIPRMIGKGNPGLALSFLKIAWLVTPLFFVSLYFLIIYTVKKEKEYNFLNKIVLLLGFFATILAGFSNLVIKDIKFIETNLEIIYGSAISIFLIIIFFLISISSYLLFKEYFSSPALLKRKLEHFLVGILIFYTANIIFNIILPIAYSSFYLYWIGDFSLIFLLGFTAYAIVKKELFDIKVIITQALVWSFVIFLLIQLFLSEALLSKIWSIALVAVFSYFGYHIIKDIKREIEDKKKIEQLGKKLLEKEKALSKTFIEIAEERAKRLCKTSFELSAKDREILELKIKIRELEDGLEEK